MSVKVQIIIAEDLEIYPTGTTGQVNKVVNPVLKMRVPFIPAGLTFTISIITTGIDFTKDNDFSIAVIDPEKNEADKDYYLYYTGIQKINATNNQTDNFNFNIDLKNSPFRREGLFKVVLMIEDELFEHEFEVVANENLSK